jgi:hypothetical protein
MCFLSTEIIVLRHHYVQDIQIIILVKYMLLNYYYCNNYFSFWVNSFLNHEIFYCSDGFTVFGIFVNNENEQMFFNVFIYIINIIYNL